MKKVIIKIDNLKKDTPKKRILSIDSLNIYEGEKIALIGPSGSGKTTLLNLISRNNEISSGSILLDELPLDSYKNKFYKKLGIIRQHFDLVEQLSVLNNILAGNLGRWNFIKSFYSLLFPRVDKNISDISQRLGLFDKLHSKTKSLSGGEKQRVAIGRILVQNPEVIIADEPVASLDPKRAEDILGLLVKESSEKTLISSLHSIDYAIKYFDRIIALKDGKIFFDLNKEEITSKDFEDLYRLSEV